ncbi:MAG: hypothetical protein ACI4NO_02565 [Oxalobacter sp.]
MKMLTNDNMMPETSETRQVPVRVEKGDEDYPLLTDILSTLPDIVDSAQNERAWVELEERLAQRIMDRVQERIGFILEEIIQQNLTAALQKVTGTLSEAITSDLKSTLEVMVTHTVSDELQRLKQKEYFSDANRLK